MAERWEKISKAEFIRQITRGESIFVSLITHGNPNPESVKERINRKIERKEKRTCKAMTNGKLQFKADDGFSYLDLSDKGTVKTVQCYQYTKGNLISVETTWIEQYYGFPEEKTIKTIIYELV